MATLPTIAHAKKAAFLAAYAELGSISNAAIAAKVARRNHNYWLDDDPAYVEAFEIAKQEATERLEEEARRRAVQGVEEPVHYLGKRVDTIRKYSDTLLIFLMKGAMPQKYKENLNPALVVQGDINITQVTNQLTLLMAELDAMFPGLLDAYQQRVKALGEGKGT